MEESGRVVGNYSLGQLLGRGSFAVVWKSLNTSTGETVAVKEINVKLLNAKLKQSLECEVSILQRVEHRNIVRLLETYEDKTRMYLVMEFCSGGDLAHYIRRCKRVSENTAHGLLVQLAAGLREMWAHNFVHRDLKPQNLLLSDSSPQAVLKIADFGFARDLQPQGLAETLCGSPLYMAPEILHFRKYDAKADLWSIGTILYELLVGHPPFNGDNHVQLLRNIEKHVPRIPTDLNLSSSCRNLLAMLLKKNPVERMSFEEFFSHPWLCASHDASSLQASPAAARLHSKDSIESGSSAFNELPFVMDSQRSGSAADNAMSGKGAPPMLLSSTRLDALMGPMTVSSSHSRFGDSVRGSSHDVLMNTSRGSLDRVGGEKDCEEEGYIVVTGPPSGSSAAATNYCQPRSPTSLASLKLRGFAAMWHPLTAQLRHHPPVRLGERQMSALPATMAASSLTTPPAALQGSMQPSVRHPVRRSLSMQSPAATCSGASGSQAGKSTPASKRRVLQRRFTDGGAGGMPHDEEPHGPMTDRPSPGDSAAALEQVANVLEAVAVSATRSGQAARSLALRLMAIQLLQLAIGAELKGQSTCSTDRAVPMQAASKAPSHSQQMEDHPAVQAPADVTSSVPTSEIKHSGLADGTHGEFRKALSDSKDNATNNRSTSIADNKSAAHIHRLKSREQAITSHAVYNASALGHSDTETLPDVWEAAYDAALNLSQAAAVDEMLGEIRAAALNYTKSVAIMQFLACMAESLPLKPQLRLSPRQLTRVQKYHAAISRRAAAATASLSTVRHSSE